MKRHMSKSLFTVSMAVIMTISTVGCGKNEVNVPNKETVQNESIDEEDTPIPATEEDTNTIGVNLLDNADFSNGTDQWFTYCFDGECEISVNDDGALDVDIKKLGSVDYGVQLYHDGFALDEGCQYKIAFDGYSDVERPIQMRFQINGGDYHAYYEEIINLASENNHYEYTFNMEESSDPAPRFCFNMGIVDGMDATTTEHHIYFDNFSLTIEDDSKKVAGSGQLEIPDIAVNQIGYLPSALKTATIKGTGLKQKAKLINETTGKTVYDAKIGGGKDNPDSGEKEEIFDFSHIKDEGTYHIEAGDVVSPSFKISKTVYDDAIKSTIKMLYYQRCGQELTTDFAEDFAHPSCHNEKAVLYEEPSKKFDVSGGWHDAGDYGRYTVAGATAAADILLAYEKYPKVFGDDVGIPESGNNIPDVLDEAKYELDWLLKMQRFDGGVYHKVTGHNFPSEVMPQDETDELIIMPVSTTATGDFAGVMAIAARVYAKTDKAYADKCLTSAKKAADYLSKTNPDTTGYKNPDDVSTGEYEDNCDIDERFWAYAELFKTTGEKEYEDSMLKVLPTNGYSLGWQGVGGYGSYAYLSSKGATSTSNIKAEAKKMADKIIDNSKMYSYGSSIIGSYPWGSNLTIANNGEYLLMMKNILGDNKETVDKQLNYLFGNNATGYCFLTGFGTLSPEHPHHRPSQATGKTIPGMIVGGPNSGLDDPYVQNVLKDTPCAKCYADNSQSYSTNEIAIYWNSPVIYLLAGEISEENK
ncbi:glycoside hydrolase family 9 protein [Pseudobutyrivibrio xylanivorans]|uniref:Endoglucanase n=1 Tax=Pseudobutyrivibrio xylanivorans DSM 14809 TaxID=1123012 RepID=A0A1M6KLR0_PSEXY|nr:glycoside hydrolase family 9 protein [Pseudobutyrivibrio xylanivorans]SHJ59836.1 endoglucanase [Pseudobutyrivibrio xylanivorans DSM 14809]